LTSAFGGLDCGLIGGEGAGSVADKDDEVEDRVMDVEDAGGLVTLSLKRT
jgi:hypothetical protein